MFYFFNFFIMAKKAREKKVVIQGVTREMADDAFGRYAKAKAEYEKLQAEVERRCAEVREKYARQMGDLDLEKQEAFSQLQCYAQENPELFEKRRSLEMAHGVIGFRTGMPQVKTVRPFTWGAALELVKRYMPEYVRAKEEVAKDKLLADKESDRHFLMDGEELPMSEAMLRCGMAVVQEETFYVEPK